MPIMSVVRWLRQSGQSAGYGDPASDLRILYLGRLGGSCTAARACAQVPAAGSVGDAMSQLVLALAKPQRQI